MTRHQIDGTVRFVDPLDFLIVIEGEGEIGGESVRAGEAWYAPSGTSPFEVTGKLTLLGVSIPRKP